MTANGRAVSGGDLASPLLKTKLHLPRRQRTVVSRPRLIQRLRHGSESALTLLSAPAGFGKTMLLTDWLEDAQSWGCDVAWLSLDDRDSDPAVFWTYVVASLQTAAPNVGAHALPLLSSPPTSLEPVLATLLNDLSAHPRELVFVLDDYHVIESQDVHETVTYWLEHLPAQAHVVVAGRADPPLPLARLRARGQLAELRAADLRFTSDEVSAYLNEVMGLGLAASDVAALEERTEGWIAALQLAALSMQGRDDPAGFVADFGGDGRLIVDYLTGEVLDRQPARVRSFLLQTSILRRLSGGLCDAVTSQADGKAALESLENGNLFLVPLDDRRHWYRYHQLFAEVLRARLEEEQSGTIAELHRRASRWYERFGDPAEAIHHALEGEDFGRAADLVELAASQLRRARQEATLRRWLEALPAELFASRPVLSTLLVGARMVSGDSEGVETLLQDAEGWLAAPTPSASGSSPMVVVDIEEFRQLPSQIAVYRAGQARLRGDVPRTIEHAHRALALATDDGHLARGGAAGMLGLAHWTLGDLEAAYRRYSEAATSLHQAGHRSDMLGCTLALGDIRVAQGRLREALSTYEHGVAAASGTDPALRGTADMHVGMSEVLIERNQLDVALDHLRTSRELGEHAGLPQNPYRWRVAMARVRRAEGDLIAARALLDDAERLYAGDYFPDVRPVAALRARVRLAQGELGDALRWADQRRVTVDDDLSYLREFEHITLAKLLLAHHTTEPSSGALGEAARLLQRLLAAAEDGKRTGTAVEVLVLQALVHRAKGDGSAAVAALERALLLAEPEGYVRVFADKGAPLASLLRAVPRRGAAHGYAQQVLASATKRRASVPAQGGLVEPLSERELDVLRLLRTELSGPDIARQLSVSLNTVRTHTKHIYTKLGANNRRTAIRRAEQLGL
jgi:LuxR family transcriptional regulator, maltose regulon positive regulatory protein